MSSLLIQRLPSGYAPLQQPLAGLRTVALNRLSRTARSWLAYFVERAQGRADSVLLAHADRHAATHPKLARELRSHVRGGSSY